MSKKDKKESGVLVLMTKSEKELFKAACRHFKKHQSTYLRKNALGLISDYLQDIQNNLPWEK